MKHRTTGITVVLLLAASLWLRFPVINAGLPFFYDEDEAHHFNRTVEMVKRGDLNPGYFLKPSLHFYLRMPVVALSFFDEVRNGRARALKEIRTRDPYGIGGYSFTASHPGMVRWNRALSVGFVLLTVLFTYRLGRDLFHSRLTGLGAALLLSCSPELLLYSGTVGVDSLMMLMCLLSSYAALRVYEHYSRGGLLMLGLLCGLAVSSKYNAAPIAMLPLFCMLTRSERRSFDLLIAVVSPAAGFLLGSPYILASIPLFLDQAAYELWHYSIAGHEGNTAEPGIAQLAFYARWLGTSGLGAAAAAAAVAGFIYLWRRDRGRRFVVALFPLLYLALMINQRANFTRNMLCFLPFAALAASFALCSMARRFPLPARSPLYTAVLLFGLFTIEPFSDSLALRRELKTARDSRTELQLWIQSQRASLGEIALPGQLMLPPSMVTERLTSKIDQGAPLSQLYQQGFDFVVYGPGRHLSPSEAALVTMVRHFEGDPEAQRVIRDPEIRVFAFRPAAEMRRLMDERETPAAAVQLEAGPGDAVLRCREPVLPGGTPEDYCWIKERRATLVLPAGFAAAAEGSAVRLRLLLMTPWPTQELTIAIPGAEERIAFTPDDAGKWKDVRLSVPKAALGAAGGIPLFIKEIHSPATYGMSEDSRRLGVALKSLSIVKDD